METKREFESRAIATLIATSHAKSLEKQLSRSLSATYALAAILKQNKSIPNFDVLAQDLIDRYGGITNLQLAPKAIVSQIFPLEGHQRAIGHDLNKNPYAIAAIKTKQLTLEGPIELIQGGIAVLGRYPVFLPNAKTGEDEFWGFTTALIELSKLLEAVDIHGLISKNYHFDLSRVDSETGEYIAFSKSRNSILENPVSVEIQIPNGKWVLSIVPKAGWHSYYYLTLERLLVLIACGALSFLGYRHFCKTNELQIQKNEYEIIFNSAPTLIIYKDDQNNILRVNKAVADFLGLKPSQIEGRNSKEFYPDHYEKYYSDDLEVFNSGKPKLNIIHPYRLKSGKKGWVQTDKVPYYNKIRDIHGILVFAIDITRQREAEIKILEYSTKLEGANKELEEFASIASHDLQEPLRKIISFGDLLKTRIPATDEKAHNYLNRMQNSALRMRNLVEDLLQYTRVNSKPRAFESLDLNKVVKNVLNDLEARIGETQGVVNIKDLPVVEGDPIQMYQLFLNLIANALKFHREGIPPVVNLDSAKIENGFWEISVEDNGIGIEEEYVDKIFKPFERLHGKTTYEGTGIGLTICNKIVSRHGGKITVKRQSTNGVTFYITLPEKQSNGKA
ncbi:MAG: PAS domain S-box protein [Nitrospinae bacterium]|nr:PAS domain S-box protein [Nitrospinota bacterium]